MLKTIRARFPEYDDMSDEQLTAAITGKLAPAPTGVDHEHLTGPSVVTAATSHELQNKAPDLKPVVKGSKAEVLQMKKSGQIGAHKTVFTTAEDTAYIIDPDAVQTIYGGSRQQAVTQAKKDLKAGGDMESRLLGYPKRDGLQPENSTDVAVDRDGNVITDLTEMKNAAESQNIIWAAQGSTEDATAHADAISKRWKTIGGEENP